MTPTNLAAANGSRPPRVLIVDDDPAVVKVLGRILDGAATIVFATSGEAALRLIAQTPPDLVLLDAEMPGMDGYAICEAIKADPANVDLPVIFVTGHSAVEQEARALALGAVDFIHKPVHPPIVMARVRTHLELKRRGDALRRLSNEDGLTGVANRRRFDEALALEWRRTMRCGGTLSLLMLDVDFFKRYNDLYGHPGGDACLQAVAACMQASVQRAGDLVARYGGEEFAILLPHTPGSDAQGLAERLCAQVAALNLPHAGSAAADHVTVSIGVASQSLPCGGSVSATPDCAPCDQADTCVAGARTLLTAADQALYRAKEQGRARVVMAPDATSEAVEDGMLRHSRRAAGR